MRWADLRDAVSFLPFAAIVLTAGPKSQRLAFAFIASTNSDWTAKAGRIPSYRVGPPYASELVDVIDLAAEAETLREFLGNRTEVP